MPTQSQSSLIVDDEPIHFDPGDTLLTALLKADRHPTGGGCLCLGGDCPHCVATVDGVAYVRTCQTPARPGMTVERENIRGYPALPADRRPGPVAPAQNLHCDVVVIGQGQAGRTAAADARADGKTVITLDAQAGQEVIGIYPGPLVVARTDAATLHVHPRDEIVIATGAAETQPVAPGNQLAGIVTARAADELAAAGVNLGKVVAVGAPPETIDVEHASGELIRFEGDARVTAVIVRDEAGVERRHACDTVAVGLGFYPRDMLARMSGDFPVRVVGDAATEARIPPCPLAGTVCHCTGVAVEDLDFIWAQGFHEMELVKRATLAGTGTCQGGACIPHLRSFLADRGAELQPAFTARPVTRQLTIGEVSAGAFHRPTPRTPLDDIHRELGAQMDRMGGWWRPWQYSQVPDEEYWAVRTGVSLGDVSTLGKMQVSGPDAQELLERLYPTKVSTIKPGRSRYVLLLNEAGYVLDDGLICCDSASRYTLTFTSGGSTTAELWVRDWADSWGLDVRILNQTMALAAINVTGPRAGELLARAGFQAPLPYMGHTEATVAGVTCRVFRLSFTGELSYELHHAAAEADILWRRLMALGAELGVKPHGLQALTRLRLEKGHILIGQDTDYDATPRRINHEWAVKLDKPDFVGRRAVIRTNKIPLDRQLVGLETALPAPQEGDLIYCDGQYAGYITSSSPSPVLGKAVMLGWLELFDGQLPDAVTVNGRPARRVPPHFYDPDSRRARIEVTPRANAAQPLPELTPRSGRGVHGTGLARLAATRIVARPAALSSAAWPDDLIVLPVAPDEALLLGRNAPDELVARVGDPHALAIGDTSFVAAELTPEAAEAIFQRTCEWEIPPDRPAFAQGALADIPVKLWLEAERVLLIAPAPFATDVVERLL
ncbi:MAG: (2Fe-2S)-binding protein [Caldilineaceae bacterium]|nr:(2Fe-2S)-binding protein [Caldilineaceae bacterium]